MISQLLRDIGRGFGRSIGWKLGALLVVAVLAFFSNSARAHSASSPTIQEAYAHCMADKGTTVRYECLNQQPQYNRFYSRWDVDAGAGTTWSYLNTYTWTTGCTAPAVWNAAAGACVAPCETKPGTLSGGWTSDAGAIASNSVCADGCGYVPSSGAITVTKRIDGIDWQSVDGWLRTSEVVCPTAGAGANQLGTPPADGDGDGTSDGADQGDNNPGIGGGAGEDGSTKPGTEPGQAGSGDGNGNTSGGGGDCKTPPHSTGNAITAGILYQTWATRCAIEGSKGPGGELKVKIEGSGTGTGGTTGGGTDMGPTNSILSGIKAGTDALKDFFTGDPGTGPSTGEDVTADGLFVENEYGENGLDQSGFGYGGSCPAPITVQVMTQSITFDAGGVVCDWVTVGGWFVMLLTAAACLRAIGRA